MRSITLFFTFLAFLAVAAFTPVTAMTIEDKLVIVTSFPKDLTSVFKKGFEKKYPGTQVEILQKKTSASVKYIQETAQGNTSDLVWASAPDAFEVLKGDGLLAKYKPKASGIPKFVGSYPINDPDGYYIGFAASGYGMMWNTRYLKRKKYRYRLNGRISKNLYIMIMSACLHLPVQAQHILPLKHFSRERAGKKAGPHGKKSPVTLKW